MTRTNPGHGILSVAAIAASVIIATPLSLIANNLSAQSCFLDVTDLTVLRAARSEDPNAHFSCSNGIKALISNDANNELEVIPPTDYTQLAKDTNGQCASPGRIGGCRYDSNITIPAPQ
jgi:hypothetical protein